MFCKYVLSDIPELMRIIKEKEIKESEIKKEIEAISVKYCVPDTENIDYYDNIDYYKIVRYQKGFLNDSLIPSLGLCRSIILNGQNKVLCFAPPKSMIASNFITKYLDLKSPNPNIVAEEFVEGTMVNVFWDDTVKKSISRYEFSRWELATRNVIGACTTFYKSYNSKNLNKTFRVMFLEAMDSCNLKWTDLDKKYCYSFVLQHPDNRIVVPIKKPQLYLVGVFQIEQNKENENKENENKENENKENENKENEQQINVYNIDYQSIHENLKKNGASIKVPTKYPINSVKELIETYASMNTPYDVMGVVLHNKQTGERTKIRNPVYEEVRQLKGNQPKLQYQYLCLRKEGKIAEFLNYYPEHKKMCYQFREQVHLFTNTLYQNYASCFIKKEKKLSEYSDQYRTHMYHLHQKYITELKEKQMYINNRMVQKYVNELPSSLLMYSLNYHMRKRNIDWIKQNPI
jgi:hypothetical protein